METNPTWVVTARKWTPHGSSMTLFEQVAPDEPLFGQALVKYFGGRRDALTLSLLT